MFRITKDPSSRSLIQYLAKITRMVLLCPFTWTWSVLWQHNLTRGVCVCVCAHTHHGSEYAAITRSMSMSTDTIEPFLSF